MKLMNASLMAVAIATGWLCGCSTDVLTEIAPIVNRLIADKEVVELFGHDLKGSLKPTDPAYDEARQLYTQARAAYDGFLNVVRVTATTSDSAADISGIARTLQTRTATFLEHGARSLGSEADVKAARAVKVLALPTALQNKVMRLPANVRIDAVRVIEAQTRWRAWDDL